MLRFFWKFPVTFFPAPLKAFQKHLSLCPVGYEQGRTNSLVAARSHPMMRRRTSFRMQLTLNRRTESRRQPGSQLYHEPGYINPPKAHPVFGLPLGKLWISSLIEFELMFCYCNLSTQADMYLTLESIYTSKVKS